LGPVQCARSIIARYLAGDSESLYVIYGMLLYKRPSDVAEELSASKRWVKSVYNHYGGCCRYRDVLLRLYDFLERFHKRHRDLVREVLRAWTREVRAGGAGR